MTNFPSEFISLETLGMAYRKAKADIYYAGNGGLTALLEYEEHLFENLDILLQHLTNENDQEWFQSEEFFGSWKLVPKKISNINLPQSTVTSDPWDYWKSICPATDAINEFVEPPRAEFRLMAVPSINFHIISALWIMLVGHQYDMKLRACSHGNRLRRTKEGQYNPLSLGSFVSYLWPYRKWRDNGIRAAKMALDNDEKVIALTADVSSFYHKLNPEFMLIDDFKKAIGIDLNQHEDNLNSLFIKSLEEWTRFTGSGSGLPVGLPASGIIANMALIELDRLLVEELAPIYYGRYVDDIILVVRNTSEFKDSEQMWDWIFERCKGLLNWFSENEKGIANKDRIRFTPSYLEKSEVEFQPDKTKLFLLEGISGKVLLDSLSHQIQARASEWRALPSLPTNPDRIATEMVCTLQSDGDVADNLRKTDAISLRRASFALKLRDYEAYARDLLPSQWAAQRKAFLSIYIEHTIVLPSFFELSNYLPRIVRLATSCEDFLELSNLLQRVTQLIETVRRTCWPHVNEAHLMIGMDMGLCYDKWVEGLKQTLLENIRCAFPAEISVRGEKDWETHISKQTLINIEDSIEEMKNWQKRLFAHDLAHIPFRFKILPHERSITKDVSHYDNLTKSSLTTLVNMKIIDGVECLCEEIGYPVDKVKDCGRKLPLGLVFSTRPFSLTELYLLFLNPFADDSVEAISTIITALRGYSSEGKLPTSKGRQINISTISTNNRVKIAVPSWETKENSWNASVRECSDPDDTRYRRMNYLLNQILSNSQRPDYVIMPELSMPASWFLRVAHKFHHAGISLIAGIEYIHHKHKVRNQVWAALPHDGLGFPSMVIYRQDKQHPALHEENELKKLANVVMRPERIVGKRSFINHGSFSFGILICSELQNIESRSSFRGKIDALFVPEWNQDTGSFNSLVESSALDIHAFIIQCNNRTFGDSRIRAPYKDEWQRDVVRLKGGKNDFFVIGEIDVQSLREFQSYYRSPEKPFKPVPEGFQISDERKVLYL